ncbi:MAG: RNA polymerase subunit sigma [Planctomycetes bacterium]|nr:RNA polymerase subunit sigma [Planctomycetota bacterium]
MPDLSQTTILLRRLRAGDSSAGEQLTPIVFQELNRLAHAVMLDERKMHTLAPTELMHEAWIRLMGPGNLDWQDRAHFIRIAAHAMRQVLVDHARAKKAQKRGGGSRPLSLDSSFAAAAADPGHVLDLHEAIGDLSREDAVLGQIVELRFFAGLTLEETARVMNLTTQQVYRSWVFARGWLQRRIDSTPRT